MIATEPTRPHPRFPWLHIAESGNVYTDRLRNGKGRDENRLRLLKPKKKGKGYLGIATIADGVEHQLYVHRLVLETFVGPCPPGLQARHVIENDRTNNSLQNLCWGTPLENAADRKTHGTYQQGSETGAAKLTEADVLNMRRLRLTGEPIPAIAQRFRVSRTHASKLIWGRMWKHVGPSKSELAELKRLADADTNGNPVRRTPATTG